MHEYKTYELTHTNGKKQLFIACCKCGTIRVKGSINENICSGKMHPNCNVKTLQMKLIKE